MKETSYKVLPCKVCGELPKLEGEFTWTGIGNVSLTHCCLKQVRLQIDIDMSREYEAVGIWNQLMEVDG